MAQAGLLPAATLADLQEITDLVFLPAVAAGLRLHNRRAVAARYGMRELTHTLGVGLDMVAGARS